MVDLHLNHSEPPTMGAKASADSASNKTLLGLANRKIADLVSRTTLLGSINKLCSVNVKARERTTTKKFVGVGRQRVGVRMDPNVGLRMGTPLCSQTTGLASISLAITGLVSSKGAANQMGFNLKAH